MHNTLYVLLSSIPMFVCGFWALTFLIKYKYVHISKQMFFWFMLTATSLYFAHFVVFNHIYPLIPITDTIYTFATLTVYPIFYLYIVALTGKLHLAHIWVLAPGVLIATLIGICYTLIPEESMMRFIEICHYDKQLTMGSTFGNVSLYAHLLMQPVILIEVLLVLFFGFRRLRQFKDRVCQSFSNTEHKDLREVRLLLIVFVITSCFTAIADLIGRASFVGSCYTVAIPTFSFGLALFIIGYIVEHQHFTIDDIEQEESLANDTPTEAVCAPTDDSSADTPVTPVTVDATENIDAPGNEARRELRQKIDQLMEEKQIFLRSDLKISDLACMLSSNRTYVHEALKLNDNENEPISFSDYVNRYRIAYCTDLLQKSVDMKIETLAYESGFISKATFYKNFKKFTGKTPTDYLNECKTQKCTTPE